MSYARMPSCQGAAYENICRSIKMSGRYKGYSILAGEELWETLKKMRPPRVSARRPTDFVKLLEELYPADHFSLIRNSEGESQQRKQGQAIHIMQTILDRKQRVKVTFEGNTFLCSSATIAVSYLRGIIPSDAWDYLPNRDSVNKRMAANGGKAVFTYGENEAVIERVVDHGKN